MYTKHATCLDLCYFIGYLLRLKDNPSKKLWGTAIHMSSCIASTLDYGLPCVPRTLSTCGFSEYLDLNWCPA